MTEKELIAKIKKLQAMTESTNPNEAAAALSRIQKLMQAYSLEQSDIAGDHGIGEIFLSPPSGLKDLRTISHICSIVKKSFGVETVIEKTSASAASGIIVIGPKHLLESCEYVFTVITRYALCAKKDYDRIVWYEIFRNIMISRNSLKDFMEERCPFLFAGHIIKRILPALSYLGIREHFYSDSDDDRLRSDLIGKKNQIGKMFQDALNDDKSNPYTAYVKKHLQKDASGSRRMFIQGYLCSIEQKVGEFALSGREMQDLTAYMKNVYPSVTVSRGRTRTLTESQMQAYASGKSEGMKARLSQAVQDHAPVLRKLSLSS